MRALMLPERYDLIICGANFAGLALAFALHKAAEGTLRVGILDRTAQIVPSTDLRAFAVSAASVKLLTTLGLWPALEPGAQAVSAIDITGGRLESPIRQHLLSYDNHTEFGEPASWIVPAELLRATLVAAANTAGFVISASTIPSRLALSPTGIDLQCTDGRAFSARLLVACDGRRSALRDLAGIKTVGWTYPQTAIITMVTHSEPHNGRARQHFLEAGPFAILPLPGGYRSSLVWSSAAAKQSVWWRSMMQASWPPSKNALAASLGTSSSPGLAQRNLWKCIWRAASPQTVSSSLVMRQEACTRLRARG